MRCCCPLFGFPQISRIWVCPWDRPVRCCAVLCWQWQWGSQSSGPLALICLHCSLTSQVTKLQLSLHPQPAQTKWLLESSPSERPDFPPFLPSFYCLWSRDNRGDDCLNPLLSLGRAVNNSHSSSHWLTSFKRGCKSFCKLEYNILCLHAVLKLTIELKWVGIFYRYTSF